MPEIIPNLHPIFVHFTVALLFLSVGLFVVARFVNPQLKEQWLIVARWALWFGAGITLITGLAGLYAYNTVAHDTPSHAAMTDHRNWAVVTIILFTILAGWSILWTRKKKPLGAAFIVFMLIAGGVLASTAWRGGEVVYRYGLGVMSLPKSEGEGHSHSHAGGGHSHGSDSQETGHDSNNMNDMDFSGMDDMTSDDGHDHDHQ
ncbi:MAG TPA: DUF2231 domain-containing protein [Gammaproteobacteria bacterium]|nr:DUF2231 domain-containing protein [Gammaproteobacteria bacterium]